MQAFKQQSKTNEIAQDEYRLPKSENYRWKHRTFLEGELVCRSNSG